MNLKLRPKILALKPGTRVVAHDYHMGDWYPDDQRDIPVPEKKVGTPGVSYIYLWVVPAKVAGKWQGADQRGGQGHALRARFRPALPDSRRHAARAARKAPLVRGRVSNGNQIAFATQPKDSPGGLRHDFRGTIKGDTIEGTVRIGEGAAAREAPWSAKLTQRGELRRAADEVAER